MEPCAEEDGLELREDDAAGSFVEERQELFGAMSSSEKNRERGVDDLRGRGRQSGNEGTDGREAGLTMSSFLESACPWRPSFPCLRFSRHFCK